MGEAGTIVDITPNAGGNTALDEFKIQYGKGRNTTYMTASKRGVLACMSDEALEKELLASSETWELYGGVTDFHFVVFSCFMIDVQQKLKEVSMAFQRNSCTLTDVVDALQDALRELEEMKTDDGPTLALFLGDALDKGTGEYAGALELAFHECVISCTRRANAVGCRTRHGGFQR